MSKEELKNKIVSAIENAKEDIHHIADEIYKNPEYGFKEFNTSLLTQRFFERFNVPITTELGITGCSITIDTQIEGPHALVMGELDGILSPNHPDATENGATHTCGHNHQIAGMLGSAVGIIESGIISELSGKITFLAVPAEEYIEIEYRDNLRKQGKIKYLSGKQRLIAEGYFDDVDIVIMFHSYDCGNKKVILNLKSNGFVGKKVAFKGKEAHAGGAPEQGINALNMATLAINNIHAHRETFKDDDWIRIHPIITKGGGLTNVVPDDVRMESYIRGNSAEAIEDANYKFNRAVKAGAMALGGEVSVTDIPGYLPIFCDENIITIFRNNLIYLGISEEEIGTQENCAGSFDFGDITHLMPSIHPIIGGVQGGLHAANYRVIDKELAYITPAKAIALTIFDLLYHEAKMAKDIIASFKPIFNKEQYLDFLKQSDKEVTYSYLTDE
ncbi:MAG: amidohydrolase [Brevinema sp.]